jgi:hypothetical protein
MLVARFEGFDPRRRDVTVELRCDDEPVTLISAGGAGPLGPGQGGGARTVSGAGNLRRLKLLRPRGERAAG